MSLPAHFPIVRPGCTEVSTKFFDCFREACQPEGNVEKARTAVQRCEKELEEYNKCFEESLKGRAQPVVLTRWEQVEEMLKDDD
ncbi:hypothetical protein Pmar_PMAR022706 [Perkinsus marinus ATCC 50983]|uniref:Uncharacterized protein n=1 Tax=Perkinsus marinus (strain ATCC 50983 / TXsc) TaxID=423536 RepID=C5KCD6_PERM5|nr:hypothetical protein Pmar_PMAR024091 [Perkinsus marinus ATCC 50983]XP_002786062.1 hypothetical protein Pmar_PMAR022706 [Perkinsus marinus ATCC 50983]EER07683.1 hypothetical protein Pmar_PMAR024091 [Perkinsus marinus ATCC 50983]EER17858.1 hypothetical protein Pmar_PMAR022706 [Perkinsus marinus ATCC 50983]|eukprot:XP_002775867.1 hypothetical protein Pmar_PMAR024091 [Perkinsus marinus ATCC 50983]